MNRRSQSVIASEAQALLDNELFNGAFDKMEAEIHRKLKDAALDGSDASLRYTEALARHLQVINGVKKVARLLISSNDVREHNRALAELGGRRLNA